MTLEEAAKKFDVDINTLGRRADGRIEWYCEHGVGHTIWFPEGNSGIHGCCGCCSKITISLDTN